MLLKFLQKADENQKDQGSEIIIVTLFSKATPTRLSASCSPRSWSWLLREACLR